MNPVYLDYNATAPVKPAVVAAMAEVLSRVGNPSSAHAFGRLARRVVEGAREQVAALVGAAPAQVIFTASGTEANMSRMMPKAPVYVAGFDRGVRPIGDWSMSTILSMRSRPSTTSCRPGRERAP